MKKGDVYRHYKGGIYTFIGIATPNDRVTGAKAVLKAKHSETEKEVRIMEIVDLAYLSDTEEPVVLYKDSKDGQLWARPVHMFFDHKVIATPSEIFPDPQIKHVKRFMKIS
jgi:hypothetical protein